MIVKKYNRDWTVREGTLDEYVINEQSGYAGLFSDASNSDILLDIGGNIGATAGYALDKGVGSVVSVEPEPDNCKVYRSNVPEATLYEGLAENEAGTGKLYVNKGKNKGLHSPRKVRGRESIDVEKFAISDIIATHKPTLMKVDIEGGEYYIDWTKLDLSTIRRVAFELDFKTWMTIDRPTVGEPYRLYNELLALLPKVVHDSTQGWKKFSWNGMVILEK